MEHQKMRTNINVVCDVLSDHYMLLNLTRWAFKLFLELQAHTETVRPSSSLCYREKLPIKLGVDGQTVGLIGKKRFCLFGEIKTLLY